MGRIARRARQDQLSLVSIESDAHFSNSCFRVPEARQPLLNAGGSEGPDGAVTVLCSPTTPWSTTGAASAGYTWGEPPSDHGDIHAEGYRGGPSWKNDGATGGHGGHST